MVVNFSSSRMSIAVMILNRNKQNDRVSVQSLARKPIEKIEAVAFATCKP